MQINVQRDERLCIRSMVLQLRCAEAIVDGPEVVRRFAVFKHLSIAIGAKTAFAKQAGNGPPRFPLFGVSRLASRSVHFHRLNPYD